MPEPYFPRVRSMVGNRWPKAILGLMNLANFRSRAYAQAEQLKRTFACEDIRDKLFVYMTNKPCLNKYGGRESQLGVPLRQPSGDP